MSVGSSQGFGMQSSNPKTISPYGNRPFEVADLFRGQWATPLGTAFGLGGGKKYDQLMAKIASGQAEGPLADLITQGQSYLPTMFGQADDLSKRMQKLGTAGFTGLQNATADFMKQLPNLQAQMGSAQDLVTKGADYVDTAGRTAASAIPGLNMLNNFGTRNLNFTAENAGLPWAQKLVEDLFGGAFDVGRNAAAGAVREAQQPVQNQVLYQNALQDALKQARTSMGARGLLDTGTGAQIEQDLARTLGADFAQRGFSNLQEAIQTLGALEGQAAGARGTAAQGLGALSSQQTQDTLAGRRLGTEALTAGTTGLTNVANTQGGLANILNSLAGTSGSLTEALSKILAMGPAMQQQLLDATGQYGQLMAGAQQLPFNALQQFMGFLAGTQNPNQALLSLIGPSVGQSSKGLQLQNSAQAGI